MVPEFRVECVATCAIGPYGGNGKREPVRIDIVFEVRLRRGVKPVLAGVERNRELP